MITQHAKEGFDHLFKEALRSSLKASPDDACHVEAIPDLKSVKDKQVVVLTISSYIFRLTTAIYFSLNEPFKRHLAAINKVPVAEMDTQAFLDVIGECGNICCGALNRELGRHFPHIGMSTPNVLDRHCVDYLHALDARYIRHFKVTLDGLTLYASLWASDYADVDFVVDTRAPAESTGELELF